MIFLGIKFHKAERDRLNFSLYGLNPVRRFRLEAAGTHAFAIVTENYV
jgi:hypothetical protein